MQQTPNHKSDLQTIADSLVSKFAGTPKASRLLNIMKTLEACSDDDTASLFEIKTELNALNDGAYHG